MFTEKLVRMMSGLFQPKQRYITVTPAAGPVQALPPEAIPAREDGENGLR